jgi:hypothetical protein
MTRTRRIGLTVAAVAVAALGFTGVAGAHSWDGHHGDRDGHSHDHHGHHRGLIDGLLHAL